jgi:hypothetical protein
MEVVGMRKHMAAVWQKIPSGRRGQGLIETALLLPVLLVVLSGLLEFGFLLNAYLAIQDAARNAARFAADSQYDADPADTVKTCNSYVINFYRQTACLVNLELAQERPEIALNFGNSIDDVLISAVSLRSSPTMTATVGARFPGADGWSMAQNTPGYATRNQNTRITSADINARLNNNAPSTGIVLVEVFYSYEHKLGLPWITPFVPNPTTLHTYAVMPLSSVEPTSTPMP